MSHTNTILIYIALHESESINPPESRYSSMFFCCAQEHATILTPEGLSTKKSQPILSPRRVVCLFLLTRSCPTHISSIFAHSFGLLASHDDSQILLSIVTLRSPSHFIFRTALFSLYL